MDAQQELKDDSGGPMTSLDDDLDELALERLELLDGLLKNKQILAEYIKKGFFNLGKARYSLGGHAVSALRIPETSIFASTKIQCNQEKSIFEVMYTNRQVIKTESERTAESDDLITDLGQRKRVQESTKGDLELDEVEEPANKKPINWFSALPPVSLRHAQSQFDSALQLAAQCASLQDKLSALDKKYCAIKAK